MNESTLAAVAAAADAASQPAAPATETPAAPAAPAPATAAAAPAAPVAPAAQPAPILTAASALEMAALAIPSARDQLTALAAAAGDPNATEASYRAACVAATARPGAEPLSTGAPDGSVKKPDAKTEAATIPSPGSIYAGRAQAMAGG